MNKKLPIPKPIFQSNPLSIVSEHRIVCFLTLLFLFFININVIKAQNGCGCTNCPLSLPDDNTISSTIMVNGATNNDLGTIAQGVCKVCINFNHGFVSDLQVRLISPSGQAVTLIAPISQTGFTFGTTWNVCFIPCGDPASPDPSFPARWTNGQWANFGNYKGTYYPYIGCLEDFNAGTVNGAWKLEIIDGEAGHVGNLLDWSIEFCQPQGLDCIRCDAKAGSLSSYTSVSACKGSGSLNLNIPPIYTPASSKPSALYYNYNYIVSKNDTIIRIQPNANLQTLSEGKYDVCGLSYRLIDAAKLPVPDGKLTVTQLRAMLAATPKAFCGEVTNSCVSVTIFPTPTTTLSPKACRCYILNNITYCQTGTYKQTLKTSKGCDSILNINLTIVPPKTADVIVTTCQGVPYIVGSKKYTRTGTYLDTLVSKQTGCDSFLTTRLLVRAPNAYNYNKNICEGDSVLQAGKYYKITGIHYDTVKTKTGCDSILALNLKVNKGVTFISKQQICNGDSVLFLGKFYNKTGVYTQKLPVLSSNGCDSLWQLQLTVNKTYKDTIRLQICQGDTVRVGKSKYFKTGNYFDKLTSAYTCDSLVWTFIEVKNIIEVKLKKNICQGDYYEFGGKKIVIAGIYNAKDKSKNGCDSLTELNLGVRPKYNQTQDIKLCYGDTLRVGNKQYYTNGTFTDTLKTAFQCDSIVTSKVTAYPKKDTAFTKVLCAPDSIIIGKKIYKTSGNYVDTLQNKAGCDSIIRLSLTVHPKKATSVDLAYCFGKNPTQFPESKDYTTSYTLANGCDSTHTFRVKIYPEKKSTIEAQICAGGGYQIAGKTYTKAGTYTIVVQDSITTCDSIITLKITETNHIKINLNPVRCAGDTFFIANRIYTTTTTDTLDYKTAAGCDSTVYLSLTVHPTYDIIKKEIICEGKCITLDGVKYCKTGTYVIPKKSKYGCDSLITLDLTVKKVPVTEFRDTICKGDFYQLGKKKIYTEGFHQDTLSAVNGCDSILSLDLTVKPTAKDSLYETICFESALSSGITKVSLMAANGCDSILTINRVRLPKKQNTITKTICRGDFVKIGNDIYNDSGTYTTTIKDVGKYRCDSTITLRLTVVDSFVTNKDTTICNGASYTFDGQVYPKPTFVKRLYLSSNQCDSIFNLRISVIACVLRYKTEFKNISCKSDSDGQITLHFQDSTYVNYFYNWINTTTGIVGIPTMVSGDTSVVLSGLSAGKYVVTIHNGAGLFAFDTINIIKPQVLDVKGVISDYNGFGVSCAEGSDAFIYLLPKGGTPPYRYRWSGGFTDSIRTNIKAGNYFVTVYDTNDCYVVFDTTINSPQPMEFGWTKKDLICFESNDGNISINNVTNGKTPYEYSINNGTFGKNSTFDNLEAGLHKITIKDAQGCTIDTVITLLQPQKIVVHLGRDTSIFPGEIVTLKGEVNLPPNAIHSIQWNDFITPQCAKCLDLIVQPSISTGYILTVKDSNQCSGTDIKYVYIKDLPVFVPNTFSPNDDGINDLFVIMGEEKYFKIKTVRIFNRWGDKIYEELDLSPNDYSRGWNGTYQGIAQNPGLFIYVAEIETLDKTVRTIKGEVFLVR